jgi:mono/diheme cytochrome c family protein
VQQAQARDPSVTAESLEHGRQLFLGHCNRCHSYPDRTKFTEEQLRSIVPRMASKAELSQADGKVILKFLLADRASLLSSGSH